MSAARFLFSEDDGCTHEVETVNAGTILPHARKGRDPFVTTPCGLLGVAALTDEPVDCPNCQQQTLPL